MIIDDHFEIENGLLDEVEFSFKKDVTMHTKVGGWLDGFGLREGGVIITWRW